MPIELEFDCNKIEAYGKKGDKLAVLSLVDPKSNYNTVFVLSTDQIKALNAVPGEKVKITIEPF